MAADQETKTFIDWIRCLEQKKWIERHKRVFSDVVASLKEVGLIK